MVICHGFPPGRDGGRLSARSFPELADRIATELGWVVLVICFRGCGESEGDFSMGGWLADLPRPRPTTCTTSRTSTRCGWPASAPAARWPSARRPTTSGCGAWPPWARRPTSTTGPSHPRRLLLHARDVGIIRSPSFPQSFDAWSRELREIRAVAAAPRLRPAAAARAARIRRRVGAGVRRPGAGRCPRRRRPARHRRRRPPAAPRPPGGGGAARAGSTASATRPPAPTRSASPSRLDRSLERPVSRPCPCRRPSWPS